MACCYAIDGLDERYEIDNVRAYGAVHPKTASKMRRTREHFSYSYPSFTRATCMIIVIYLYTCIYIFYFHITICQLFLCYEYDLNADALMNKDRFDELYERIIRIICNEERTAIAKLISIYRGMHEKRSFKAVICNF